MKHRNKYLLLIPLILALIWMVFLVLDTAGGAGLKLSPSRANAIITGLFVFIIAYGLFLGYVLYALRLTRPKPKL